MFCWSSRFYYPELKQPKGLNWCSIVFYLLVNRWVQQLLRLLEITKMRKKYNFNLQQEKLSLLIWQIKAPECRVALLLPLSIQHLNYCMTFCGIYRGRQMQGFSLCALARTFILAIAASQIVFIIHPFHQLNSQGDQFQILKYPLNVRLRLSLPNFFS